MSQDVLAQAAPSHPPELLNRILREWVQGPMAVLHAWGPSPGMLEDARVALLSVAESAESGQPVVHAFSPADLLALLQRLNTLVAASASPSAQDIRRRQVWILKNAERMDAANLDILRRICMHYPELGVRLMLLSQTHTAPEASEGVEVLAMQGFHGSSQPGLHELEMTDQAPRSRLWWWLTSVVLIAGAAYYSLTQPSGQLPKALSAKPAPAEVVPEPSASAPVPEQLAVATEVPQAKVPAPTAPASVDASRPRLVESPNPQPVSASRRWLSGLPGGSLVVVHAEVNSLREAEKFRAEHALLANARILLTTERQGRPARYLVVTGHFRSSERVTNYLQRLPWKNQARGVSRDEMLKQVTQ